jgi:hypothetical protein
MYKQLLQLSTDSCIWNWYCICIMTCFTSKAWGYEGSVDCKYTLFYSVVSL